MATDSVGIIGSGPSALITAHTLIQDGFSDVQILSRDSTPGGVWSSARVYPDLQINNVHGEYHFTGLEMPATASGRVTGEDMRVYMQNFASQMLDGHIRYQVEVLSIRRDDAASQWFVTVESVSTKQQETLQFSRIVLCTGGCDTPKIPEALSESAARSANFKGKVIHSKHFAARLPEIEQKTKSIVIVGGGKSAQDMAACLANRGCDVTVVFEKTDAFLASPSTLPPFIRKSRPVLSILLSIMAGHRVLHTRLERFFHTTWLGSCLVWIFWVLLKYASLFAAGITPFSRGPLRPEHFHPLFWSTSVNDEGVPSATGFHALVQQGKIQVVVPARLQGFGKDGVSVVTTDWRSIPADILLLATGYQSSWASLFDEQTAKSLGMAPTMLKFPGDEESEATLFPHRLVGAKPQARPAAEKFGRATHIYQGIVPSKNIARRDFAINGAVFTTNIGYTWEVVAHWISSYFLNEPSLRVPATPEEADEVAKTDEAWMHLRYPDWLHVNESYSSLIAFWTWPQYTDQLLQDIGLSNMRSGGNWFSWPFKVVDLKEISTLKEERAANRSRGGL
ncbi:FAD/NAD(P)-binding domain-containing protein [Mycena indigotica]|uniref:FAD/NAD(P)-binding domain-containing protein n=1 Tax=Mycena indigotica TaxID=2126181 RepID=A0A8H6SI74_9AGAR|nr:FAD/NAD(P)-binding domain-containing protein [Mycena indigotica]KAF7298812.1 FAD/NAD(P)-binding domain-containing protein [Mycena indigotica]